MVRIQPPLRAVDRNAWIPPALSAVILVAIAATLVILGLRFPVAAARLGVAAEGRRIFSLGVAIFAGLALWRAWSRARLALRLRREGAAESSR